MRVVLDMTEALSGHNITCDNFFTSHKLGQELLKRKLTMVGTVRKNKPELSLPFIYFISFLFLSSKIMVKIAILILHMVEKNESVCFNFLSEVRVLQLDMHGYLYQILNNVQ